jgi:hypothetical protein
VGGLFISGGTSISGGLYVSSAATVGGLLNCLNGINVTNGASISGDVTITNPNTLHARNILSDSDILTLTCGGTNNTYINNNKTSGGGDLHINASSANSHTYIDQGDLYVQVGNLYITNNSQQLIIKPGYKGNTANSAYTTYDMGSTQTHYFWDNVEISNDLTIGGKLYQQTSIIGSSVYSGALSDVMIFTYTALPVYCTLSGSGLPNGYKFNGRLVYGGYTVVYSPATGYSLYSNTNVSATSISGISESFIYYNTVFYQL